MRILVDQTIRGNSFALHGFFRVFGPFQGFFGPSGRALGANNQQSPARQHQIGHTEQRNQLRLILCQPRVALLPVLEEGLDHVEGMFDLGANARLEFVGLFAQLVELVARQGLALTSLHRHMPAHRGAAVLFALAHSLVASIAKYQYLLVMQRRMGLGHIFDVARRANHRMYQTRLSVYNNVCLQAEIPLIAFLGLMHIEVTHLAAVLGRRRAWDQSGIDDSALAHQQPLLS